MVIENRVATFNILIKTNYLYAHWFWPTPFVVPLINRIP